MKLTQAHCLQCPLLNTVDKLAFSDGYKFAEFEWGQEEVRKCKPYFAGGWCQKEWNSPWRMGLFRSFREAGLSEQTLSDLAFLPPFWFPGVF